LEVFIIPEKALTPYITFVLLLSLLVNLAPHPIYLGDIGSRVSGFWEDLFGSSDSNDSPPIPTESSSDEISKIFLEISRVDGESTDDSHINWIEILSFNMGMTKPSSSTTMSRSRGDLIVEDITVSKELGGSDRVLSKRGWII
jgi:hypothetical protein